MCEQVCWFCFILGLFMMERGRTSCAIHCTATSATACATLLNILLKCIDSVTEVAFLSRSSRFLLSRYRTGRPLTSMVNQRCVFFSVCFARGSISLCCLTHCSCSIWNWSQRQSWTLSHTHTYEVQMNQRRSLKMHRERKSPPTNTHNWCDISSCMTSRLHNKRPVSKKWLLSAAK